MRAHRVGFPEGAAVVVGLAAAAGLFFLTAAALDPAPGGAVLLAPLYHRITASAVLAHGTRARLFAAITQGPGVRAGTLASSSGLDYKTVRHHLRHLVRVGLVHAIGEGQARYYPANAAPPPGEREAARTLACPSVRLVFDHLQAAGTRDLTTLTAELGLAKSTVSEAAAALRRAGLVEHRREHRRVVLRPVDRGVGVHRPTSVMQ